MSNDEYVCWSRMQAEAGQPLEWIVARKELERQAGDGVFGWGVGNAPARVASMLARLEIPVRAIFSVMKCKPKLVDVAPRRVAVWRRYVDRDGAVRRLPSNIVVTSRADSASGAKDRHAALLCHSEQPLRLNGEGQAFDPNAYVNAGDQGRPIGASQVTALLRRVASDGQASSYRADMIATLTGGYWVKLLDPLVLTPARIAALDAAAPTTPEDWLELAEWMRQEDRRWSSRPFALELTPY